MNTRPKPHPVLPFFPWPPGYSELSASRDHQHLSLVVRPFVPPAFNTALIANVSQNYLRYLYMKLLPALTGVAQLVGRPPAKENVASSIPDQGTRLGGWFSAHSDVRGN